MNPIYTKSLNRAGRVEYEKLYFKAEDVTFPIIV